MNDSRTVKSPGLDRYPVRSSYFACHPGERNTKCRIFPLKFFTSCYLFSRKKEGWTGLWRGITPRLSGIALQSFAAAKFDELVPPGRIY